MLFCRYNGLKYDCVLQPQPKTDEIGALVWMLNAHRFPDKTLIVMNRGYEGYNMIAHLVLKPNVDFLLRVKDGAGAMREVAKLPMMPLDRDLYDNYHNANQAGRCSTFVPAS